MVENPEDRFSHNEAHLRPGDPEQCRAKATKETTKVKGIFQHYPPLIKNLKEARNEEPESNAFKENQRIEINSDPQSEAKKPTTKTTTLMATPITTTPTTSPTPTTKPVPQTLAVSPTIEPTPTENGHLADDGSVIEETKGGVDGDPTEMMADTTVYDDDSDNVGHENPSSSDTKDDNVGTKLSLILDIFKKGKMLRLILRYIYLDTITLGYCPVYSFPQVPYFLFYCMKQNQEKLWTVW